LYLLLIEIGAENNIVADVVDGDPDIIVAYQSASLLIAPTPVYLIFALIIGEPLTVL